MSEWISAHDALLRDLAGSGNSLIEWAGAGLVRSRALAVQGAAWESAGPEYFAIPQSFWGQMQRLTGSAYRNWRAGIFRTGLAASPDHPVATRGMIVALGVQFACADLDRLMPTSTNVVARDAEAEPDEPEAPEAPEAIAARIWSEAEMTAAIISCGISDRDSAWHKQFKQSKSQHGWGAQGFRDHWSKARGTKGVAGRPIKHAR